jgi:beta-phosphoglucomutase-like phosphatase (HAD superfamily)
MPLAGYAETLKGQNKLIEAVIFDMDGVIIGSHKVAYDLLTEAANKYGADITKNDIISWGSLSSRQFWKKMKDEYHLPDSVDFYISHYDRDEEISRYKSIGLISGIPELIKGLKLANIKIALATSASRYRMSAVIKIEDLKSNFDCFVCDEDVSESKPNPEICHIYS